MDKKRKGAVFGAFFLQRRKNMNRVEEFNKYISDLMDYWEGKNDDFEPMQIPKEVDEEMQKDSFY